MPQTQPVHHQTVFIQGVQSHDIAGYYPEVVGYIEQALTECDAPLSTEEIFTMLTNRQCQLWLIIIEDKIIGCYTTCVDVYQKMNVF